MDTHCLAIYLLVNMDLAEHLLVHSIHCCGRSVGVMGLWGYRTYLLCAISVVPLSKVRHGLGWLPPGSHRECSSRMYSTLPNTAPEARLGARTHIALTHHPSRYNVKLRRWNSVSECVLGTRGMIGSAVMHAAAIDPLRIFLR